ncbi:unnamed protein product [Cochlearia groenlandica]
MAMPPQGNIPPPTLTVAGNWIPDGRDGFISYMRCEFAAANSIIDLLCQHLISIGDQNEYESVISTIQNRQLGWSQALYMQHYIPVPEVSYTLQQVALKRQHRLSHHQQQHLPSRHYSSDKSGKFGGKRSGFGYNKAHHHGGGGGYRGAESMAKNGHHSNLDCHSIDRVEDREEAKAASVVEEKRDDNEKPKSGNKVSEESESAGADTQAEIVNHSCNSASKGYFWNLDLLVFSPNIRPFSNVLFRCCFFRPENNLGSEQKQDKKDHTSIAKTFVVQEMYDAKMVNVVEGLKLYDKMVDAKDVSQIVSLVNNLRIAGRRGQLQSEAYVSYKRPNRGHGREMIQLGLPVADMPPDDEGIKGKSYEKCLFLLIILCVLVKHERYESCADRRVEPIPSFLSDIIDRFVSKQIIPVKPDSCIIDFFNEGDHSQPHMFVPWFRRPVGILSLSECDLTFGRVVVSDHPGDYKGSLKLSITPGSVLMVEGKSADLAKFAIHSTRKQRILITFTKSQPRNSISGTNWGPPLSRSPNHNIRHQTGPPKHYPVIPSTGVLPTSNGAIQPIFVSPSPPMPFPGGGVPPGPTGWPLPHPYPRHQQPPQPRMPTPGTGVYLPNGSTQEHVLQSSPEKSNKNGSNYAEGNLELKRKEEACEGVVAAEEGNGSSNGEGKESK